MAEVQWSVKVVGTKLASLQYHFATKADLLAAVLKQIMDAYLEEVEATIARAGSGYCLFTSRIDVVCRQKVTGLSLKSCRERLFKPSGEIALA